MRIDLTMPTSFRIRLETVSGVELENINQQLKEINMKVSEITPAMTDLKNQIVKVKVEVIAALALLESKDPDISPEGVAALDQAKEALQGLDDVFPDIPTGEQPPPAEPEPEGTPTPTQFKSKH